MIETQKIYLEDGYKKRLSVTILQIVPYKKMVGVITDKTIFYPEGGGPPGDRGTLGGLTVVDTQYNKNREILHIVSKDCALEVGKQYELVLDWAHRYHYMKEHTCQHLISGILYKSFSIDTVSVHLGEKNISIETQESAIHPKTIEAIEDEVNKALLHPSRVTSKVLPDEELSSLELRRAPKVSNNIRIVTIEGYDEIACGGVHLNAISEIGSVLFQSSESIRGHVRLFFAL